VRLGERFGDGANMCRLELVDYLENEALLKTKKRKEHLEKKQRLLDKQEEQEKSAPMMAAN
jgi:hypothetical protein